MVAEERRTRTEDDPDGYLSEEFLAAAYKAHPYGWPIIGWMSDILRINPTELRAFYNRYYLPNNALLVVAGDVETARVLARVRETFGRVPRGPAPPPMDSVEPPQLGERRVQVYKPDARAPIVYIGYHVPNYASADAPALELLSTILQEGRASRLYRRLVYERRVALNVGGDYSYLSHDPNLFWFSGTPLPGQTPAALEQAIMEEIVRAQNEPVPGRGAGAGQEPDRGRLRVAPGLDLLAGGQPGPLRADRLVAEQRDLRALDSKGHRGRPPAGGADLLPGSGPHRGHPAPRRSARRRRPVSAMRLGWTRGVLALLVIAALSVAGAWAGRHLNGGTPTPVSVTGTIEATQVDVSVKITGRILERLVKEGDKVSRGQLLVRLDDSELAADVKRQEAALRSAQASAARSRERGAPAGDRGRAGRRVERGSDAEHDRARVPAERPALQAEPHRRPGRRPGPAGLRGGESAGAERAGEARPHSRRLPPRSDRRRPLAGDPGRVGAGSGAEPSQRGAGDLAHRRGGAPEEPGSGETANPGVPILTLVNPKDVWLRAYVPETEVGRLKVGDTATLRVDAFPNRVFAGRLIEIGSEAEYTPRNVQTKKERVNLVFRIKIQIDNPEGLLKPGLPADADVG